jgi:hypothetical protein
MRRLEGFFDSERKTPKVEYPTFGVHFISVVSR